MKYVLYLIFGIVFVSVAIQTLKPASPKISLRDMYKSTATSSFSSETTLVETIQSSTQSIHSSSSDPRDGSDKMPIILEKAYRAPYSSHFSRSAWTSSSSVASSVSSSDASSVTSKSKPAYCFTSDESWLDRYPTIAEKEAAKRIRVRICR